MDIVQILIETIKQLGPVGLTAAAISGVAQESGTEIFKQVKNFFVKYKNNEEVINDVNLLSEQPHNKVIENKIQKYLEDILNDNKAMLEAENIALLINEYSKDNNRVINTKNYIETLNAQPSSTINIS